VPLPPGKSRLLRRHYLAPEEQVLVEMHPSKWFYFPGPVAAAALVLFFDYWVATRLYSNLPQVPTLSPWLSRLPNPAFGAGLTPLTVIALVLTVAVGVFALQRWYLWAAQTYAVTNDRLIQQKGIVNHIIEEIPLQQVRDMNVYQQSLRARVFRVGTIRVQSLSEFNIVDDLPDQHVKRTTLEKSDAVTKAALAKSGALSYKDFEELKFILDPKEYLARASGIEWWVGVPNPFKIERLTQTATRGFYHPGSVAGSTRA